MKIKRKYTCTKCGKKMRLSTEEIEAHKLECIHTAPPEAMVTHETLKAMGEVVEKHMLYSDKPIDPDAWKQMSPKAIAIIENLQSEQRFEQPVKFSGQCEHHIPIGQNCIKCEAHKRAKHTMSLKDVGDKDMETTEFLTGEKEKIEGMKDSGSRQGFSTGAVRDASEGKPMLSLISPISENRLGNWLTKGSKKYAARNWEKGMPMDRTMDSLMRHVNNFRMGDKSEDHLAAIMCNAMFLIHFEEMIAAGKLPAELDNLPTYVDSTTRTYLTMAKN